MSEKSSAPHPANNAPDPLIPYDSILQTRLSVAIPRQLRYRRKLDDWAQHALDNSEVIGLSLGSAAQRLASLAAAQVAEEKAKWVRASAESSQWLEIPSRPDLPKRNPNQVLNAALQQEKAEGPKPDEATVFIQPLDVVWHGILGVEQLQTAPITSPGATAIAEADLPDRAVKTYEIPCAALGYTPPGRVRA